MSCAEKRVSTASRTPTRRAFMVFTAEKRLDDVQNAPDFFTATRHYPHIADQVTLHLIFVLKVVPPEML